jgi:hypothetical protein
MEEFATRIAETGFDCLPGTAVTLAMGRRVAERAKLSIPSDKISLSQDRPGGVPIGIEFRSSRVFASAPCQGPDARATRIGPAKEALLWTSRASASRWI